MTTTTTATTSATMPTTSAVPAHRGRFPATYARIEILATLKRVDTVFFTVLMPLGMYLLLGKMSNFESTSAGHGNITASVMISMAAFSVAIASTALAASSAVELAGGWGRQVSLTSGGMRAYLQAKLTAAIAISALPVGLLFAARLP